MMIWQSADSTSVQMIVLCYHICSSETARLDGTQARSSEFSPSLVHLRLRLSALLSSHP